MGGSGEWASGAGAHGGSGAIAGNLPGELGLVHSQGLITNLGCEPPTRCLTNSGEALKMEAIEGVTVGTVAWSEIALHSLTLSTVPTTC